MSAETEFLEKIVARAHSADAETRSAALKQLLELPDEALLHLLENRNRHTGVLGRRLARRMISALPYSAFGLVVAIVLSKGAATHLHLFWFFAWLVVAYGVTLSIAWASGVRSLWWYGREGSAHTGMVQKLPLPLVTLLAGRTNPRFLPALLSEIALHESLFERSIAGTDRVPPILPLAPAFSPIALRQRADPHQFMQYRRRYRKGVQGILTRIQREERIELNVEEQYGLLLLLQLPEEDVQGTLCILERLPCWGDAQAAPVLKRLIREKHWYVGSEQVEVAARQCLAELQARLHSHQQGSTLLRPIDGTDATTPQALLRPAAVPRESAPEQLLRPENSPPPKEP